MEGLMSAATKTQTLDRTLNSLHPLSPSSLLRVRATTTELTESGSVLKCQRSPFFSLRFGLHLARARWGFGYAAL